MDHKAIIDGVDIYIQICEIVDNKYLKLVWGNDYFDKIIGQKEDFSDTGGLIQPDSINPLCEISVEEVQKAFQHNQEPFVAIYKHSVHNCKDCWFYTNITPFKYHEGKVCLVLCASIDITGRAYNPERYAELKQELVQLRNKVELSQLSKAEQVVLKHLAMGEIEKEIATNLNRSTHTVKTHLKNMRKKLGYTKNTELVKFAIEKGIV